MLTSKSFRKSILCIIGFCLVVIGPSILIGRDWDGYQFDAAKAVSKFDFELLKQIEEKNPEIVLIGNSMLATRIDRRELERLSGKRVISLHGAGIMSTWYPLFKNFVVNADVSPTTAIVLFRHNFLTEKVMYGDEQDERYRERFVTDHEPVLNRILSSEQSMYRKIFAADNLEEHFRRFFRAVAASFVVQDALIQPLRRLYYRATTGGYPDFIKAEKIERKVKRAAAFEDLRKQFGLGKWRKTDVTDIAADTFYNKDYNFHEKLKGSFLVPFMELARQKNIKLVFVRVKTRPGDDDIVHNQPPERLSYVQDLKEYLVKNGAGFHDFTDDRNVKRLWYSDGDHIGEAYMGVYTNYFYSSLKDIIDDFS